jgi:N-alpha-acetyltransferase 15/16, NatA auxiliary subunit
LEAFGWFWCWWLSFAVYVNLENLTPGEQKKLRNKQRKKAKQEASAREKQKQEEQQRQHQQQQHNKSKNQDPDLEGPKEELLVPEKLQRVWTGSV